MKTESWKYTNIKKWSERDYHQTLSPVPIVQYADQNVFPDGVIVCSLQHARVHHPELVNLYLGQIYPHRFFPETLEKREGDGIDTRGDTKADAFSREAKKVPQWQDPEHAEGLFIYISKNVSLDKPLKIIDAATASNTLVSSRNLILLAEHSSATILRTYSAHDAEDYWRNQVTEIHLAANAQLNYYQYQNEAKISLHTHYIAVQQARDAQFNSFTLDNGGGIVRTDLHTKLEDTQANCQLRGIYLVKEKQHIDNHTIIEHQSPHTSSHELYKGIITDQGRAIFNGRILVAQHAQKVLSEQHNKNLLLSQYAEINTKPELEIYADDVQCAHGATIGELDREAIFYLTTRGIEESLAKQLLTYGFAHEMFDSIENEEIKQLFNAYLISWFSNQKELESVLS